MRRPTVSRSFWPWSIRLNFARLVLSQSCSEFFSVVSFRLRIISLIVSLRAAISPWASREIERVKSPLVTADTPSAPERPTLVRGADRQYELCEQELHLPPSPG